MNVEHVAVTALKVEIIEKGHSFPFDAFKNALLSHDKGTPEFQVATNHLIMDEIKKLVIPDEFEMESMFFRMMIERVKNDANTDFMHPFSTRIKFEDDRKWLSGFLKRIKIRDSRYYQKEMIIDFMNFRPRNIEEEWEREALEYESDYSDEWGSEGLEESEDFEEEEEFEEEGEFEESEESESEVQMDH